MAVFAVVDETGFQRRLDARDDGLVDVALALFAPFDLGLEVEQLLAVDDREATLFLLRRVDQHVFHVHSLRAALVRRRDTNSHRPRMRAATLRCTRKRVGNRKESPWTAVRADQQIGGRCSVGACVVGRRCNGCAWAHGPAQCRMRVTGHSPRGALLARLGEHRNQHPPGITGRGTEAQPLRRAEGLSPCCRKPWIGFVLRLLCRAPLPPRRRFGTAPAVAAVRCITWMSRSPERPATLASRG